MLRCGAMSPSISPVAASRSSAGNAPRASQDFLVETNLPWRRIAWFLGVILCSFLLYCSGIASGPDYTVGFRREVVSRLPESQLSQALLRVRDWPKWFSSVIDAQVVDASDRPLPKDKQLTTPGALILLKVNSGRGYSGPFEIVLQVTRLVPGSFLELKVLDESTGRLFHYFGSIVWRIELHREDHATRIIGTESVRTANWRSRVFGRIARKIMMSQIFYPDLIKLADPTQALVNDLGK